MRLVVLLAVLGSACVPTARSVSAQRGRIWVAPGSPTVFSWVSTVEHRETRVLELGKNDSEVRHETDDDPVRTAIFAIDPATRNATRLGQLDGAGGEPVYYDAARDILWVSGKDGELAALTRSGNEVGPPHHHRRLDVKALPPPFVLASDALGVVALHDLRRDGSVPLGGLDKSEILVTGDMVRFSELTTEGDSIRVRQIAVDWSSGRPQRLPDIDWVTAPLPPSVGMRLGIAVLRDGRRYAEVVRDATGTRLLVFDIAAPAAPVQLVVPVQSAAERPKAHLVALADDVLVFGESGDDDYACWRGATIRVDRQQVVPLAENSCVVGANDAGSHRVLLVKDVGLAAVGADGSIVSLDGIDNDNLAKGITTGPSTRVIALSNGALEEIDLATGTRRVLARGEAKDRLLTVDATVARYARDNDKVVTVPLGDGAPSVVALGEPTLTRVDRMPRDRTEFWLGAGGGGTTTGNGAGFLHAEVAHWVTDHVTWAARANMRFEGGPKETDRQWIDLGGSFGYAWHRLPRLFSLFVQADIGANYTGIYVGEERVDRAFSPSLDARVGWQGKMAGFDLSATLPSFIDFDRGVLFMLSVKIGFTENLH